MVFQYSRRGGVVDSTPAYGSIGRGFEFGQRYFSHHSASAFSKLRSLAKCSLTVVHSASYPLGIANRVAAYQW